MNITRNPFLKAMDVIFGTEPAPKIRQRDPSEAQSAGEPKVSGQRATRPLKRNEIVPHALQRALVDFISDEVQTYVNYYPNTRFELNQIVAIVTPENRQLLTEVGALKRKIRNGIAMACIEMVEGATKVLDLQRFCDWNIETAADAPDDDQRIYIQLAGSDRAQQHIGFLFYGDFITVDTATGESVRTMTTKHINDVFGDGIPTLDIASQADYTLSLRIFEPGYQPRSLSAQQLPLTIGRGSICNVQLQSPYVSRTSIPKTYLPP